MWSIEHMRDQVWHTKVRYSGIQAPKSLLRNERQPCQLGNGNSWEFPGPFPWQSVIEWLPGGTFYDWLIFKSRTIGTICSKKHIDMSQTTFTLQLFVVFMPSISYCIIFEKIKKQKLCFFHCMPEWSHKSQIGTFSLLNKVDYWNKQSTSRYY